MLRAKIQKRISLQQRINAESEIKRKIFDPASDLGKKGPSRLNMDRDSRKTVMKILQDNKQKLRQTRQEMIQEIKRGKKDLINVEVDMFSPGNGDFNPTNSSMNLSATN